MTAISPYEEQIVVACRMSMVKELYAFGSILTSFFNAESDVDLIVDFQQMSPSDYASNYFQLKFALEDIFGRPVDLLETKRLKNPYLKQEIENKRQLVYGA
jgi:uncharacterized protein